MSKFLAPIHFKQYDKIKNQNMIIEEILKLNEEQAWVLDLREDANKKIGELTDQPLEEIIDESNIHGWLSEKIDLVETKLAYIVSKILETDEDSNRRESILTAVKNLSRNLDYKDGITLTEIYQLINEMFLDGMPCDRITEILEITESSITWKRTSDIHSVYWKYGEQGKIYFQIRDAFIEGLIEKENVKYEKLEDNVYRLKL